MLVDGHREGCRCVRSTDESFVFGGSRGRLRVESDRNLDSAFCLWARCGNAGVLDDLNSDAAVASPAETAIASLGGTTHSIGSMSANCAGRPQGTSKVGFDCEPCSFLGRPGRLSARDMVSNAAGDFTRL